MFAGLSSCSNEQKAQPPPRVIYKQDTVVERVVVNITDTVFPQTFLVCKRDTAYTVDEINEKLNVSFKTLLPVMAARNGMQITGPRFAWYRNESLPLIFETGLAVDSDKGKLPAPFFQRTIKADSAYVAHFYGPYSGVAIAHQELQKKMRLANKKQKMPPFEIYVDEAYDSLGKPKNPYRVLTDIIYLF